MNHLLSGLWDTKSIESNVMIDPRIKDLHYTEIIRSASFERRLN